MSGYPRYYCVYIMGSLSGTLYIGFSGNLHKRVFQHKFHHFEGFTDQYDVTRLLYWESYDEVYKALARETQLKGWSRAKKIALIVRRSPHWVDLAAEWYRGCVKRVGMLRLRSEDRFALLTAPLSMTMDWLGYSRRFCLGVQLVDLLLVALLNNTAAQL
jgi:putative endonuclease